MNETAPARDPASPAHAAADPAAPGALASPASRGLLGALAVGLMIVVAAAWFEGYQAQRALRTEVAHRLTDADAALAQAKAREADLGNELREAQAKLALVEARVGESQAQQASLEALYRELAPSRDELALNEIEQVLLLASQQLAIAGNVQAAVAALQLAEAKLARVDRPQLVPLRRSLARDIDRLKSVPFVDVAGMSLKLDQIVALVDTLPLAKDERLPAPVPPPPPPDEAAWLRLARAAWAEVKGLVRVEVADRPVAPLVPPPQQYFLRENLRLRLLTARMALLAHNDAGFKADVGAANAWVRQYFDTRAKVVQTISSTLTQLAATPMPAELPDVAASLNALQAVKAIRDRSSGAAAGR